MCSTIALYCCALHSLLHPPTKNKMAFLIICFLKSKEISPFPCFLALTAPRKPVDALLVALQHLLPSSRFLAPFLSVPQELPERQLFRQGEIPVIKLLVGSAEENPFSHSFRTSSLVRQNRTITAVYTSTLTELLVFNRYQQTTGINSNSAHGPKNNEAAASLRPKIPRVSRGKTTEGSKINNFLLSYG